LHVDETYRDTLTDRGQPQFAELVDEAHVARLARVDGAERHVPTIANEDDASARAGAVSAIACDEAVGDSHRSVRPAELADHRPCEVDGGDGP
jgi:hypothetical protein